MVLTIVGMVGFASILAAVCETPAPPEPMYAAADVSQLSVSPTSEEGGVPPSPTEPETLLITVLDNEKRGVAKANVILRSPDREMAFSGVTDAEGKVRIELTDLAPPPGKAEGYLTVKAMKEGYRDFTDEYFIKVIEDK